MLVVMENLISQQTLSAVREQIAGLSFTDGKASAGAQARRVKSNEEVLAESLSQAELERLNSDLLMPLHAHPTFQAAALPLRLSSIQIARYGPGMHYSAHTDDPMMGSPSGRYRADLAITLMLSDASEYDGGCLCIETSFGRQRVALAAGSAVVYPASSLHLVEPVSRGERLVGVAWAQSTIRSSEQRQVLFDLWKVRETLLRALPDAAVSLESERIYTNLVRMWAQV